MTKESIKNILQIASVVIILILTFCLISSRSTVRDLQGQTVITETDTLFIRDTVEIVRPDAVSSRLTDTIRIPAVVHILRDTVRLTDTVYIEVQREQKHYSGPDYDAWISGYRPELDSLRIYRNTAQLINTTTVNTYQRPKRWGIGIQVGYGMTVATEPKLHPYIGIGLSYNILTF